MMARTSGAPGDRGGATMFLAPASAPGIRVGRHIDTLDRAMIGGHCEVFFEDLFVPDDAVLGAVDEGFAYAQVRLGPARMTHVMRWLGAARRGHDVAVDYVARRDGFGSRLGDLGMVQQMVADNEIDIAATRALLTRACWELDQGGTASDSTSIAKTFGAEAIFGSWTGRSRCAVAWASRVTCRWPGCRGRCVRSGCTTARPRCIAGRSRETSRRSGEAGRTRGGPVVTATGLDGLDLVALQRFFGEQGVATAGELRARLISGGKSNLTFEVSDGVSRWVLRRPPTAGLTPSAHDVAREYRVCARRCRGRRCRSRPRWCCARTARCWVRRSRSPGSSTAA